MKAMPEGLSRTVEQGRLLTAFGLLIIAFFSYHWDKEEQRGGAAGENTPPSDRA